MDGSCILHSADLMAESVGIGNFGYVSSAMFHGSQPSLGSGQGCYPICMLNRTDPGEFLEINQCLLNIHIPRFQQNRKAVSIFIGGPAETGFDGFEGQG